MAYDEALAERVREAIGRKRGVDALGMKSAADLKRWVGICVGFVSTLPAKVKGD